MKIDIVVLNATYNSVIYETIDCEPNEIDAYVQEHFAGDVVWMQINEMTIFDDLRENK